MMRTVCTAAFLVTSLLSMAQNRVPNGSFEEYTTCPTNFAIDLDYNATGWTPFRGTPDYFHECSPNDTAGVPLNLMGYQAAATGAAYAGMICYGEFKKPPFSNLTREYLGIQLTDPLTPGVPVHLSFKTVFASSGPPHLFQPRFNCTGIGLRFSMVPFWEGWGAPVLNNTAIYLDQLITDSVNWTLVEGTYMPDSAYTYLVVGSFFDDAHIQVEEFDPEGNAFYAYFYVDDVCVTENPAGCEFTGVQEQPVPVAHIWPNPFDDRFHVRGIPPGEYPITIRISEMSGRTVYEGEVTQEAEAIEPGLKFSEGAYAVSISTNLYRLDPILLVHRSF